MIRIHNYRRRVFQLPIHHNKALWPVCDLDNFNNILLLYWAFPVIRIHYYRRRVL